MEKLTWQKCGDLDVEIWMGQWSMIPKQIYLRGMNTFVQLLDKRHWFMATKWSMCFLFETEPWWEVWTHLDSWYRLILIYAYSWPWYCEKTHVPSCSRPDWHFQSMFLTSSFPDSGQTIPTVVMTCCGYLRPRTGARTWSRRIRRSGDISLWWPSTCIVTNCWMTRTNRQQLLNKIRDSTKIQQDACSQGVWMDVAYEIL